MRTSCIYCIYCIYIYTIYIYNICKTFSRETFVEARSNKVRHLFFILLQKLHLVPNGLRLKNPFRHHPDNYVSQEIIDKASAKLSNIALHKAYAKQKRLSTLLNSSSLHINEIINEPSLKTETFVFFNKLFQCAISKKHLQNSLFVLPLPQQYCTIICHWHAA